MNIDFYLQQLNIFVFAKDRQGKFLFCNEKLAMAAGAWSPKNLMGKDDYSVCWREQADFFRAGDIHVLQGKAWNNIHERQCQVINNRERLMRDVVVSKYRLIDKENNCIGVIGSYVDITGDSFVKKCEKWDPSTGRIKLGSAFGNEYLTKREVDVLREIILGKTALQIAHSLNISKRTVEVHTESIKSKMQCSTKGDIVFAATTFGLTTILF